MNILLLGSGGREHALAWKMADSPLVDRLYCAPGNPGIANDAELVNLDLADSAAVAGLLMPSREPGWLASAPARRRPGSKVRRGLPRICAARMPSRRPPMSVSRQRFRPRLIFAVRGPRSSLRRMDFRP